MRLARDRWYSNEGQRRLHQRARTESMGTRRIVSLCLLLLMILVVMQQLKDPKKYKPAFEAIGLTPSARSGNLATTFANPPDSNPSHGSGHFTNSNNAQDVPASVPSIAVEARRALAIEPETFEIDLYIQMWLRLFKSASPEVLHELAKIELATPLSTNPTNEETASATIELSSTTMEWLDTAQTRVDKWQQEYRSMTEEGPKTTTIQQTEIERGMEFITQWHSWASLYRNGITLASSSLDQDIRLGLQLALDRQLLGMVNDNSPWRPQERPVLARTLQRAATIAVALDTDESFRREVLRGLPIVEVNSLTKQANEYRGQLVRIIGNNVTNSVPTKQEIQGWGNFEYEVVWIRPVDSSQQPICVYAIRQPGNGWPKVSSSRYADSNSDTKRTDSVQDSDLDSDETPLMEISGILLKRLAYSSQRGIDVAPVLIACSVRRVPDAPLDDIGTSTPKRPKFRSRRWIEPGEQAANLQLLGDVFGKELESLWTPTLQSKLTETNMAADMVVEKEIPALGRILYQIPRVSRSLTAAIATGKKIGPAQLGSLQGRVQSVQAFRARSTVAGTDEPPSIFQLGIESHSNSDKEPTAHPIKHLAYVNRIPSSWSTQKEVSQPISLSGFYFDAETENGTTRCWIADHPDWSWRWQGEASQSSKAFLPPLNDDWMQLGAAGFDLSHIDGLRNLRGKSLASQESEAFYSLIDCSDRLYKSEARFADPALSAIDCLRFKDPPHLRRVRAKVHIVRATRILVTDEKDQTMLDGESYYELDGLANLGDRSIQLKSADGKESVYFNGEYPITLIAKQLPDWLATSNDVSSESLATWYPRTTIEVEGIFYRLWSFSTAQTSAVGKTSNKAGAEEARLKQIGPLVAVTKWEKSVVVESSATNPSILRDVLIAMGFAAIGIYAFIRWNQPRKRRKA